MALDPNEFENIVRDAAAKIWNRPCVTADVSGVNIDGLVKLSSDKRVLIEVTLNKKLQKIRDDIIKINSARSSGFSENVYSECYIVTGFKPTTQMQQAASEAKIHLLYYPDFRAKYFDFTRYHSSRIRRPFGSASGHVDSDVSVDYIPVHYRSTSGDVTASDIASLLQQRRKVVQVGEFGSGKSRCAEEVFHELSKQATSLYPIAIDLRNCQGLTRWTELVRRHLDDIGEPELADSAIKAVSNDDVVLILDGFDEVSSQSWSSNPKELQKIRFDAMSGVRDLVTRCSAGVLIIGREHYFDGEQELHTALGLADVPVERVQTYDEFTSEQMAAYLKAIGVDSAIPSWMPKRPLICEMLATASDGQVVSMVQAESQYEFWTIFFDYICGRDSAIDAGITKEAVRGVLVQLARVCRDKSSGLGPLSLSEVQRCFEHAVGTQPIEHISVMVQRLPGLGRATADSNERQFVDRFIVEGLWAQDFIDVVGFSDMDVMRANYQKPLPAFAKGIVADAVESGKIDYVAVRQYLLAAQNESNHTFLGDLVAVLAIVASEEVDYGNILLNEAYFDDLDVSELKISNIEFFACHFEKLDLTASVFEGVFFNECLVESLVGVSSDSGLPSNFKKCDIGEYQSVDTIDRIRDAGLSSKQKILIAVIRKTFFQPGAGRKEEALTRGFGDFAKKKVWQKVLALMVSEGLLTTAPGNQGTLYIPARKHTARMRRLLAQLTHSKDPIWQAVSEPE